MDRRCTPAVIILCIILIFVILFYFAVQGRVSPQRPCVEISRAKFFLHIVYHTVQLLYCMQDL